MVVFSLPGAYTPTCSSTHVPRYNELAATFRKAGVDDIVCISVNDAFVMSEWQKDQNAPRITFIPDGNGEFTEKMGLLVDKSNLGFGKRSWRYSMLVRDGTIVKMFIEPEKEGDPFEVSDADTMLSYLAPHAEGPGTGHDLHQGRLPALRSRQGAARQATASCTRKSRSARASPPQTLRAVSGKGTTPQVFIGGQWIGGADELERHFVEIQKKAA